MASNSICPRQPDQTTARANDQDPDSRPQDEAARSVTACSPMLRNLSIEQRPIRELKPNPRNARTHSTRQIKAIAASIRAFGFTTLS